MSKEYSRRDFFKIGSAFLGGIAASEVVRRTDAVDKFLGRKDSKDYFGRTPTRMEMIMMQAAIKEYLNPNAFPSLQENINGFINGESTLEKHFAFGYATTGNNILNSADLTYYSKDRNDSDSLSLNIGISEPAEKQDYTRVDFSFRLNSDTDEAMKNEISDFVKEPEGLKSAEWEVQEFYSPDENKRIQYKRSFEDPNTGLLHAEYVFSNGQALSIVVYPRSEDPKFFIPQPISGNQ